MFHHLAFLFLAGESEKQQAPVYFGLHTETGQFMKELAGGLLCLCDHVMN